MVSWGPALVEAGDAVEYGQDLITIEFGVPDVDQRQRAG
jgi:hypothetical protein